MRLFFLTAALVVSFASPALAEPISETSSVIQTTAVESTIYEGRNVTPSVPVKVVTTCWGDGRPAYPQSSVPASSGPPLTDPSYCTRQQPTQDPKNVVGGVGTSKRRR